MAVGKFYLCFSRDAHHIASTAPTSATSAAKAAHADEMLPSSGCGSSEMHPSAASTPTSLPGLQPEPPPQYPAARATQARVGIQTVLHIQSSRNT